jgi:3-oxoadipate enol-lactonase
MPVLINGLKLNVVESGNPKGLPVVFLHGFPFSHAMWDPQVELLKKPHRLITYDHRGHGQSEVGELPYMFEFFVDDFLGVLDYLKIGQAVVCGLSMGGYMALRAYERSPDRFRALVLCDTQAAAESNEGKIRRANGLRTLRQQGVKIWTEGFLKGVLAPETFESNSGLVEKIRSMIQANSPAGIAATLVALATRTDTTAILPKIKIPTLILVGDADSITPPAVAQAMKEKIPKAELYVIPHAAHLSNLENPPSFNQHFLDFLAKVD